MHLDYTKVIILILWWRNFQLEYWRTFQLVSTTLGNEKSIDIRVTKDDGSWISVDVKSVRKGNAIPVGNAVDKDNHYYVFVIYNNKFSDLSVHPDFYIVPSHIVVERRKEFNGGPIDIFKKDIIEYQNKWEILGTFVENGELSTEKNDEG